MSKEGYLVVFKNVATGSGYNGIRTQTSFEDKDAFDEWFDDEMKSIYEVVEQGVTEERALWLVSGTPASCRIKAALQASTISNGEIDENIFRYKLQEALYAISADGQRRT